MRLQKQEGNAGAVVPLIPAGLLWQAWITLPYFLHHSSGHFRFSARAIYLLVLRLTHLGGRDASQKLAKRLVSFLASKGKTSKTMPPGLQNPYPLISFLF